MNQGMRLTLKYLNDYGLVNAGAREPREARSKIYRNF